jgi:superfamily II DNA/RNA helicase
MTFHDLDLHEGILKAVEALGYTQPTPIQSKAIPIILKGNDLRASAQTGTGKTAAFLLPILNLLTVPSKLKGYGPRALILVPTRELAIQVAAEATKYSKFLPRMKTVCIYGGAPYPPQIKDLSRPYEILVATPGRLIDHLERERIDFGRLELFVLDEADRMLDMGFIQPVEEIAAAVPKTRQTLLFSATLKGSVLKLSQNLLKNPVEVNVEAEDKKNDNIEQRLHFVDNINHKHDLLDHLLKDPLINQAIVFTATKHHAELLMKKLLKDGHNAGALHGDMNQRQRIRTIDRVRDGDIRILVATDVAARGIDVLSISHVINFDWPSSSEDYVHRIGRTGRAGAKGLALSFASSKDMHLVRRLEEFTGQKIVAHIIEGLEPQSKPSRNNDAPKRSTHFRKKPQGNFRNRR